MKFGHKQYDKPTPKRVSDICDFIAGAMSVISGFLVAAPFVCKEFSDPANLIISALIVPMALHVKKYFGSETSSKKVSIDKVEVIDESKQ